MGDEGKKPEETRRRPMVVSKGWVQGIALVMILGFTVMGILAYHTYNDSIPIPDKVVSTTGEVLFTHDDIVAGQEAFNNRGLMEYGSIVGHGGYLGPDFTADYLRRAATLTLDARIKARENQPHQANIKDWRTNRYDSRTGVLVLSRQQTAAYHHLVSYYTTYFGKNSHNLGLLAHDIKDPAQARHLTDFFAWTAWGAAADRPGHSYSYTNNWPADPTVANRPTADMVVWSVLSLIVLIGGTGVMFAIYGRWSKNGP